MDASGLRRFCHVYRDSYSQERSRRKAKDRARRVSSAEAGFWLTFGVGTFLNTLADSLDLWGTAWTAVRYVLGFAWLGFGVWYLSEVLTRRRRVARRKSVPPPGSRR